MRHIARVWPVAMVFAVCSCINITCLSNKPATPCGPVEIAQVQDGNFTLYVSNQSFFKRTIDMCVLIDGKVAVNQNFKVRNQHNWQTFLFNLPQGQHSLKAVSSKGKTELETTFSVGDKNWASLDYWYSPRDEDATARQKRLSFRIQDEPIGFI